MTRKAPLCRNCGMPMKGHSKSGCLVPNLKSATPSPEPKERILSTPSFVIPETGPFRRQNPNYVLPPPLPKVENLPLSSASFTPTEPVSSMNERSFPPLQQLPTLQQFTPNWSRPSSPQSSRRVLKQQSSFVAPAAPSPASVFGTRLGDSVRLVAGIYEVSNTIIKPVRARALSNGIYCVPIEPLTGSSSEERTQDVDMSLSTWLVTGPKITDVDALVANLQPRRNVWWIRPIAIMQKVRHSDALHYGALALFLLYLSSFIFRW